jgi:hypothetical protein
MARFSAVLLAAAALAAVLLVALAQAPKVTTDTPAAILGRGIVKKLSSTGGALVYKPGSAVILGNTRPGTGVNKNKQTGFFTGASPSLVDASGLGVVLTSGPASNIQTGAQIPFSPSTQFGTNEPLFDGIIIDNLEFLNSSWVNGVSIQFDVDAPVGIVSGNYAYCTQRSVDSFGNSYDLAMVTVAPAGTPNLETNVLLFQGNTSTGREMVVQYRFSLDGDNGGAPGPSYGLSNNFTRCLAQQTFGVNITQAGTYTFRYTVANAFNSVSTGRSQQLALLPAAGTCPLHASAYNENKKD